MAINLQVESLTKSFGERVLFENITFGLEEGQRIGLIAANGTGKTTLLNIITGREDYQSGAVVFRKDIKVGYLEQDPHFPGELNVLEACFYSENPMIRAISDYEKCISSGDHTQLAELTTRMDSLGAWDYEQRAKQILGRLKITDFTQSLSELSGGQIKRIALANALITEPDLLILDEPTNHLDLEMTEWLEKYLSQSKMSLLMVTHDRFFLDRVCSEIIEIDERQIYTYKGNYSYYVEKRQERIELGNAVAEKTRNLYKRELEWIRRTPSARTGKAKYRVDAFDELSTERRTAQKSSQVKLGINASRIGTKIFEIIGLNKSYGEKIILRDFSYTFSRGEKLGIVGENGVGKSTFIKMLLGEVEPDGGVIDIGETVRFGYYSQTGLEFDESLKVIDVVKAISEDILMADGSRLSASQFLQQFLFTPQSQHDFVYKLSGGERRRLYLCTILMSNPNFLVLDEPTNDLDIRTLNVLEEYLATYAGCVIVVSHDRYFMDKIADHIFALQGEGVVKDFPGNYTEYRDWMAQESRSAPIQPKSQKIAPPHVTQTPKSALKTKLTFNEKREFEIIEQQLPALEDEKSEIERQMSSGTLSTEDLMAKSERISDLIEEIDTKTMRWLELSERV